MKNKMNFDNDLEIFENLDELIKFVQRIESEFE